VQRHGRCRCSYRRDPGLLVGRGCLLSDSIVRGGSRLRRCPALAALRILLLEAMPIRTLCGAAPVAQRSGKSQIVLMRYAAHVRLRNTVYTLGARCHLARS
jgi:hypothetical protein